MSDEKKSLRCSFCGRSEEQVERMIQGPGVRICDSCIRLCMSILDDEEQKNAESHEAPEQLPTPGRSRSTWTSMWWGRRLLRLLWQ